MKKLAIYLCVLCALCGLTFADTHTSVGDGLWSAAATWNPAAVPADGDTVNIDTSGEDIIFDVDQSAFVGLAGLTIASGASLTASTTAGAYVLKMNADLTLNGTLQAGTSLAVPYPSTCTFTIDFAAGSNSIVGGATGRIYFYCAQPTNYYAILSGTEIIGETELSIDRDLTGDSLWAVGATVRIGDNVQSSDSEWGLITATATAPNTITVNISGGAPSGLVAQKESGAYVILCSRNIKLTNSTDYFVKSTDSSVYNCEFDSGTGITTSDSSTFTGATIHGGTSGIVTCYDNTYNDCMFAGKSSSAVNSAWASTFNDCIFSGVTTMITAAKQCILNNCILNGASTCISGSPTMVVNNCTFTGYNAASNIYSSIFNACTFASVNNALFESGFCKFYNCNFVTVTNENASYNTANMLQSGYTESSDHDQVVNAFKAWSRGGIVTSQTASPPTTETRYAIYYQHACETNLYPTFHQYLTTVSPGAAIEVEGYIQIPAIDLTSYPPKLQIIDTYADPLIDSLQTALDQDQPASVDGTVTTWQPVDVIWANTGDSSRQVYVRMIAYSHDVSTHNINMVWSVASYQDQVAALYNSLIPIRTDVATADTPTSFTLTGGQAAINAYRYNTIAIQDATDGHWEQRKILSWTSGRVTTVDHAFSFTPAAGDLANILSVGYGEDDLIIAGTVPDATSTANSIKLGANASSTNDIYNENLIVLTGGTGAGQARLITDYFGATKRAAVRNPWVITPDATTTYRIAPFSGILLANTGVCDGGTVNSITLRTPAPATADLYNGHTIFLSGGTGMGQARLITDYSAELVATVSPNWDITPVVDDTVYIVLPVGLGTIYSDITAIKAVTDIMEAVNSTVSVVGDANSFTIANTGDINDVNDAYNGMTVYVEDATTGDWETRLIDNWETGRVITVDADFTFTPEVGDIVIIWGISYFPTSVYNGLPLPPEGETINVDRRVAPAGGTIGGTRTLDAEGDDPP